MLNIRTAVLATFGVIGLVFAVQAQVSNRPAESHGTDDAYRPPSAAASHHRNIGSSATKRSARSR